MNIVAKNLFSEFKSRFPKLDRSVFESFTKTKMAEGKSLRELDEKEADKVRSSFIYLSADSIAEIVLYSSPGPCFHEVRQSMTYI